VYDEESIKIWQGPMHAFGGHFSSTTRWGRWALRVR
jgi:hypothetical protein